MNKMDILKKEPIKIIHLGIFSINGGPVCILVLHSLH